MKRLLFLLSGLMFWTAATAQPGPLAVIVAAVEERPLADRVEALGTVQAREFIELSSGVAELVSRLHFEDGDQVEAGQLLVELEQAAERAELASARARLAEKRSALERAEQLHRQSLLSAAERDLARAELDSLAAQALALEAAIADRTIRAPFAGRLGLREVSPGAYVTPGQRLTRLFDLSTLRVEFTVPESRLHLLEPDSAIRLHSASLPGREFSATLGAIAPGIDPQSRSARGRAWIQDPDPRLRPGMLLELEISVKPRPALMVPESALISRGSEQFIYSVDEGQARRHAVRTGARRDGQVEIVSGLTAGQTVIVHGASRVRPGQAVTVLARFDGSVPMAELIRAQGGS